jgi:hypothetical protein
MVRSFLQFVYQRQAAIHGLAVHPHAHSLLVGFDHQALVAHPPHQVERLHGLAPQRHLFHVGRHATLDRCAQLLLDREEAVGGAHPVHALMGPAMVVVLHPVSDPFARLFERLELRPLQELVLERLPEALDLPQRHRVMRGTADVMDVVALKLLLKPRRATPRGVLRPVVGQQLLRLAVRARRLAVYVHHVTAQRAAEHPQPRHEAGVIIQEPDDVGRPALEREVRDVALPHLVGR